MGYKIGRNEKENYTLVMADNQRFTQEDCERLWKEEKIYYNQGVFAMMIQERKNNSPLCILGIEDDGNISFSKENTRFDIYWLQDLINVTNGIATAIARKEIDYGN